MLTAAVSGCIFSAPTSQSISYAIDRVSLHSKGNYNHLSLTYMFLNEIKFIKNVDPSFEYSLIYCRLQKRRRPGAERGKGASLLALANATMSTNTM